MPISAALKPLGYLESIRSGKLVGLIRVLDDINDALAMSLSSVSAVANALRLRAAKD